MRNAEQLSVLSALPALGAGPINNALFHPAAPGSPLITAGPRTLRSVSRTKPEPAMSISTTSTPRMTAILSFRKQRGGRPTCLRRHGLRQPLARSRNDLDQLAGVFIVQVGSDVRLADHADEIMPVNNG